MKSDTTVTTISLIDLLNIYKVQLRYLLFFDERNKEMILYLHFIIHLKLFYESYFLS